MLLLIILGEKRKKATKHADGTSMHSVGRETVVWGGRQAERHDVCLHESD